MLQIGSFLSDWLDAQRQPDFYVKTLYECLFRIANDEKIDNSRKTFLTASVKLWFLPKKVSLKD